MHSPTVGFQASAVSYERGTPAAPSYIASCSTLRHAGLGLTSESGGPQALIPTSARRARNLLCLSRVLSVDIRTENGGKRQTHDTQGGTERKP